MYCFLYYRHKERSKLIHCIHLQQVELTERTSAGIFYIILLNDENNFNSNWILLGQEYAANIAKEFAKVIESFEERLIAIEENVLLYPPTISVFPHIFLF